MDLLTEIRRLYYRTTPETIHCDLARALELLKSMPSEAERERAAVYMDGLSQMRSEWSTPRRARAGADRRGTRQPTAGRRSGRSRRR